ncbi:MAG: hypothetical protein Q8P70_01485 [bacterium]|nr:hypothetical protein [bacterium]
MSWILIALISISLLFFFFLGIKERLKLSICPLCLAVSGTWAVLLVLYLGWSMGNPILLGVLMGQSVLGLVSLAEKKAPHSIALFRLPLLLTLTFLAVALILGEFHLSAGIFVLGIWVVFGILWVKRSESARSFVLSIISCCKDW